MPNVEDLRVRRTHKLLFNAFMELIQTNGIEDISITDICDKAMVNRATFYKHFDDKYTFYCFCIKEKLKEFDANLKQRSSNGNIKDYYLAMIQEVLIFLQANRRILAATVSNPSEYTVNQLIHDVLLEEIRTSLNMSEKNGVTFVEPTDILSEILVGSLVAIARWALLKNDSYTNDEIVMYLSNISRDLDTLFTTVESTPAAQLNQKAFAE